MTDDFDLIEQVAGSRGPESALALLAAKFKEEKNYSMLFEVRMLVKRRELGLPLIATGSHDDLPEDTRPAYEQAFLEAAREAGSLFLAAGDVARAWPYFRAIGDRAPVAAAIENWDSEQEVDVVLQIALEERVNPRKGFELLLARHGLCRAITYFEQYPDPATREQCAVLLIRSLHTELIDNLRQTIARREGQEPEAAGIETLIAGRDWLFGDLDSYVDTSHLIGVIRFALDVTDSDALRLALELCAYGARLSANFRYQIDPPFNDVYIDHAFYLRALLGEGTDTAVAHFRAKVAENDPNVSGSGPAQVLVALLARLKRYSEAIQVSLDHLSGLGPDQLACPSVLQLCQLAGDYQLMRKLARERGDLLSFTAAALHN